MAVRRLELAEALRERRRELGLTRMRLAERCGLAAADIAKWERGEDLPNPDQVAAIAAVVGLDDDDVRDWTDVLGSGDLPVDIGGVAVQTGRVTDPPANPPPQPVREIQGAPSRMDRLRLMLGRRSTPPITKVERPGESAPARSAPSDRTGLVANLGRRLPAVFPDSQVGSYDPAVQVYSTAPSTYPGPGGEQLYRLRRIRTTIVLLGLGIIWWWAYGALGEGFSDVLDLFRGPAEVPLLP